MHRRIFGSCSIVDLKRVIGVVQTGPDPFPEELYTPKGKLALAFVIFSMDAGMSLEDMADIREVKLWDDNCFEVQLFPRVDQEKRAKWKAALARPVPINARFSPWPGLRRLSK